jgi:hypothetical protein
MTARSLAPGSGNGSLEKRSARAFGRARKARIPITQRGAQCPSQRSELDDPRVEQLQLLGEQRPSLPTGCASPLSHAQQLGQFGDRDAECEPPSNELYAGQRRGRVQPVSICRARRPREETLALVVAERVGADTHPFREGSSLQETWALIHGSHAAPCNRFQGQVPSAPRRVEGRQGGQNIPVKRFARFKAGDADETVASKPQQGEKAE